MTDQRADPYEMVDRTLDANRLHNLLIDALGTLRDDDRHALLLLAWESLTYEQVAVATDVPIGTVRSRLHRARKQLRELIDDNGQEVVEVSVDREKGN